MISDVLAIVAHTYRDQDGLDVIRLISDGG